MLKKTIILFFCLSSVIGSYSQDFSMVTDTICKDIIEIYTVDTENTSVKNGKYERYYKGNVIIIGEYSNNVREGNWTLINGKNFRSSGKYENNKKAGEWSIIKGRDTIAVITYDEDKAIQVYTPYDRKLRKASSKSIDETTIRTLTSMPMFEDGNLDKYRAFVNSNIEFPVVDKDAPVEGKIYVEFTVNEIGQTQDVKILQGIIDEYDAAALKIIKNAPPWIPGIKDGEPVKVKFIFPIVFKL